MMTILLKKTLSNVDFYSGIILKAMGFPFCLLWICCCKNCWMDWHWNEMIEDKILKLVVKDNYI